MAAIVETLVGDKRLQLGVEEFVRPFAFGNNWNYIRVGVRMAVGGSATITNAQLQIGVCSGTTATFNNANTTDYIGAHLGNGFGAATFTYNAGPPAYYNISNQFILVRRVGNTNTTTGIGSNNYFLSAVASGANRSLFMVDFLRLNSTSMTIKPWIAGSSTAAQTDAVPYILWRCAENEVNPFTAFVSAGANFDTVACGSFYDTVSIYWNKASPTIEVSEIMVMRYA